MSTPPRRERLTVADRSVALFALRCRLGRYQHSALAVARSAGRLGIPVHGMFAERWDPAARSRYVRDRVMLPESVSDDERLDALLAFGRRHGRSVLLPMDDVSAVFVGDHASALGESYLFPRQPDSLLRRLADKHELHELCLRLEIPTPDQVRPADELEASMLATRSAYPVVAKRAAGWLESADPAAPSVVIANGPAELLAAYRRMRSPHAPNVLVQEYIPGAADTIWMFNGYFDAGSECLVGFSGQKLRQAGPDNGPTTLGVCRWNDQVVDATKRLAKEVGYHGIIDVGYRYDARDGRFKLLDVNPRIGSSFRLFVGHNDLDVLRAMYLDLTGQPVPAARPLDGRRWIDEPHDLLTAMQLARRDGRATVGWRRSLRGIEETAWFARDDPRPFMSMFAGLVGRGARWLWSARPARRAA